MNLFGNVFLLFISATLVATQSCGPGFGSCPPGQCCSALGLCGTTEDYCKGPDCQLYYSDSCDAFIPPPGQSTAGIPRPHIGNVPYGTLISDCVVKGTIALTFDDGPWIYTSQLLDLLESYNVTATFFVVGNNLGKGHIDDNSKPWPAILQRIHSAGHQIGSHSWTHQYLSQINSTFQQAQVIYNEMAFRNLFGWFPTYFRCPYLDCTAASGCFDLLNNLGYHIINIDIDTKDYMNDAPDLIQNSKDTFSNDVSTDSANYGYIPLTHDIHYQTVINLTAFMIETLFARGYRPVTVGECLGDPPENWYRDASGTTSGNTPGGSNAYSSSSIGHSTSTSNTKSISSLSQPSTPASTPTPSPGLPSTSTLSSTSANTLAAAHSSSAVHTSTSSSAPISRSTSTSAPTSTSTSTSPLPLTTGSNAVLASGSSSKYSIIVGIGLFKTWVISSIICLYIGILLLA